METIQDRRVVGGSCKENRFDASQYAFFGKAGETQEVELGGLEDDDEANDVEDDEGFLSSRDELGGLDASSELGDLGDVVATSFTKLNVNDSEGDKLRSQFDSYIGKDVHELPVDINWTENNEYERQQQWVPNTPESSRAGNQWWTSANQSPAPPLSVPRPHAQAPVSTVGSSYRQQQFPASSAPQVVHGMMPYGLPQQPAPWSPVHPVVSRPPPQQVMLQYQRPQGYHGVPPPFTSVPGHPMNVLPINMQKLDTGMGDGRGKQTPRGSPDSSYISRKGSDGLPQMRSKYMTAEEIETIVRIQWAATHGSDPYTDDYYHQAMQAKLAGGTPHGRRHFAPSHLRELPPHARTAAEPHAFLQVDALGRIPFSSIRRPRPLLDVDGVSGAGAKAQTDSPSSQRRLEQEPMLAARIAIEDGLCLLLDVDDIDRMLATTPQPDGGLQLRRRRQMLLEGLAASLQLVDPLAPATPNFVLNPKDDLVFLRLVSLPKGRKLLTRYLRLLPPGSELVRIVLMAVFRHLRFLFGGVQSDQNAAASSAGLTNAVAANIKCMDLASLSACLAAVLLASEPPPLRPLSSPSGDGATVVLQAVLDRATGVLSDRSVQYPVQSTTIWQASFDAFFGLLSKYCTNKYESIMHSLMMASSGNNSSVIASAAGAAMAREIPIELLRASLPHTNEQQRKRLLEFAQRSIVTPGGSSGIHSASMDVNTAAVRG